MKKSDFTETSKPGGVHHMLGQICGQWEGEAKTWFEPGKLADTSPVKGSVRLVAGGKVALHEYEGSLMGQEMHGVALMGYHLVRDRFFVAWCNNCHNDTGILFSLSDDGMEAKPENFSVTGAYNEDPKHFPDWYWRTTVELRSPDNLVITHYNITPEGEEARAVEIDYRRVAS